MLVTCPFLALKYGMIHPASRDSLKLLLLVKSFDFCQGVCRSTGLVLSGLLSVTLWLRMWLDCKAAQGLDFHDYLLIKNKKRGLALHYYYRSISQRCWQPVALGIGLESCLTYFHTIPLKNACGPLSVLLPLLAAST